MALVSSREHFFSRLREIDTLKIFILLAITTWVARFWHCQSFGLYEDDLYKITSVMGVTGRDLWKMILGSGWEGRPLQDSLIYLLSFLGIKLGGLHAVYGVGYLIVTLNAFLFFTFLKRLSGEQVFAVTGALAFCLFPADTTQALLTHALGVQPSLTFLLIALLCYLSGRKKISYGIILGSLLCYETMYPVFLAAPLLKKKWDSKLIRELAIHALILGIPLVCAFIVRRFIFGEMRCVGLSALEAFHLSVGHTLKGPLVSISMFLYRPAEILRTLTASKVWPLSLYLAGLSWVLFQLKLDASAPEKGARSSESSGSFHPLVKLAWTGWLMLVLAYPITFTTTVAHIAAGRESRVHAAAIVGASILCACVCSAIFHVASARRRKGMAALGLGVFFTLLVGFGLNVQQDYEASWRSQRAFWTDVVTLCPDMTEGTIILVPWDDLKDPQQIKANFVGVFPMMLDLLYRFPDRWKDVPSVFALDAHWPEKVVSREDPFLLGEMVAFPRAFPSWRLARRIKSSNIILLENRNGRLVRRTEPLILHGLEFKFKERPLATPEPFSQKPLYGYMIKNDREESFGYLVQ